MNIEFRIIVKVTAKNYFSYISSGLEIKRMLIT